MARRRGGRQPPKSYVCPEPPCLHVVVDERKGIFKVFFEDSEYITPIPARLVEKACKELASLKEAGVRLREAEGQEVDYLARKYLGASPVEEEEEVVEEEAG